MVSATETASREHLDWRKQCGWLIRDRVGGWAAATDGGFHWVSCKADAIWFMNRESAEQIAAILGDDADAILYQEYVAPTESRNAPDATGAEFKSKAAWAARRRILGPIYKGDGDLPAAPPVSD